MELQDFKFGYADATKELMLEPEIFESAFFDSRDTLNKLLNTWKYMLIGRKGVGKSAYSSKIQYIGENSSELITCPIQLNDFEYTTFSKANSDSNLAGTKKYLDSWNFIILLNIYKILHDSLQITEIDTFNDTVNLLDKLGFSVTNSFKTTVTNVSRLKLGANVGVFDAQYETEFGHKPISFSDRISSLVERMLDILSSVYLNKKIILLIDGVDDILRIRKNQLEILSSLIRSVDVLNQSFFSNKIKIKILLFIREDIINLITDPDLNKIKRDGSIHLSWVDNTNDLKEIAELRFNLTSNNEVPNFWYSIFPQELQGKPSWEAFLEYTLYKPRDVLQFLCTCQELYPHNQNLSFSEMKNAIKNYSREYFIEEMKNELTGYTNDSLITSLASIFQKLGSSSFYYERFLQVFKEQSSMKEINEQEIKQLLLLLFESGYVGQLVRGNRGRESVIFKYRNPDAAIDYCQKFLIHRGIQKGLSVIL